MKKFYLNEEEITNLQNTCERLKNDNEYTKIYKKTLKKIEELKKELSDLKKADRITLYTFDLSDEVIYEVHGKYNIYNSHNGVVVLKKISD